jgi:hydrophobe/amphiphile efflux-1 (HAE1) family protein
MNLPHFFIDRPIFAGVLSIVIVLVGLLAYLQLPVALFPEVVPPTVVVRATYPGATAQVVADTVATPIEQEINGVENMLYMNSISTNDGQTKITVTFKLGTDLDIAQVLTQNRVSVAEPRLPEEARRLGVTTQKESPDLLMVAFLYSEEGVYDQLYVSNYAILQMKDVLARVEGVGDVQILGAREYSMRIWLDPERIQAHGLTGSEVVEALRTQNVQVAAGQLAQPPVPSGQQFQTVVNTQGRFIDPEQFGNVIIKSGTTVGEGRVVRVRDIARVELGGRDYNTNSFYNGRTAVALILSQRPGSNALATAEAIEATLDTLRSRFPPGLKCEIGYNPTEFVKDSIAAVQETVFEAVLLVVLVVIIFLQDWRSAIIPLAALPVSLIGTFAVLAALGFSLNNLSLFGLVLAIGIVVDDAIVVVENVERHLELGEPPREATRNAMNEVGGPVVAIALVLSAVFIPTAFISGISGQFYRQFAITIAVATVISAFNSLTLSPALCALLLRPHGAEKDRFAQLWDFALGRFFGLFNRGFAFASQAYADGVRRAIRLAVFVLVGYVGLLALTGAMFRVVPTGFIPQTDQAYIITAIQLPDGASVERTDAVVQRVGRILLDTPGVAGAAAFSGFSGVTRTNSTNAGVIFSALKPFAERVKSGDLLPRLLVETQKRFAEIKEAQVISLPPPTVRGIGTLGGFAFEVEDIAGQGSAALQSAAGELIAAANQDAALSRVFTFFRASSPQIYADIDRTKAEMLGVESADVLDTLQVYMGSAYVNDFNLFGRTFRVTAQADAPYRLEPEDIAMLHTRSKTGAMVPLGSLTTFRTVAGPEYVTRYNLRPAAELNGNSAPGASSSQAIAALERLAREKLPRGYDFEWTGLYFQEILAGNTTLYIFPLCVLFVFLTLAALYESWSLPLVIILIVPMCLLAAVTGVWLRGMDNNILTQIGFVVLVGLACKNAILIVEFAKEREDEGLSRVEAAIEACRLRLRPILMTSFAFIFGVVPLVIARGAGAEMRQALGTAVFFGMLGVTLFGLLLTPVFYVSMRWLVARIRGADRDRTSGDPGSARNLAPVGPGN